MRLEWLELRDFRCYETLSFRPDAATNLLIGANGAGKTSVLEAVGYLSRLRSFRGSPDVALVRDGGSSAIARGEFAAESRHLVEVEIPVEGRRRILVDGKRPRRFADVAAMVRLVAFLPDDLDLVKRGPALRRDYLDDVAVQIWPAAAAEQTEFERALRQRNALLREYGGEVDTAELAVWDTEVALTGARVMRRRLLLLGDLGPVLADVYRRIDPDAGSLTWRYDTKLGPGDALTTDTEDLAAQLGDGLAGRHRVDKERRVTTVGPHRDEPGFDLDGRDVRTQASQGEQRSTALSLRIAAFELIRSQTGDTPILLLDDVFSELDAGRADALVGRLPEGQIFVTSARPEDVPLEGVTWSVDHGTVQ